MRALLLLLAVPALAGCELLAFPDDIAPSDKVKTEQQAIAAIDGNCGPATPAAEWDARLEGGTWQVWWSRRQNSIAAEIDKKSGQILDCQIDIQPDS